MHAGSLSAVFHVCRPVFAGSQAPDMVLLLHVIASGMQLVWWHARRNEYKESFLTYAA